MDLNVRLLLREIVLGVKASFWVIPLVMVVASLMIAPALIRYDVHLAQDSASLPAFVPQLSPEGARMILSAIAGSMITVASLVFSMTLVALSLVAQQLGPRILQIFMEDRPTQMMLGLFIATFILALIVLASVGSGQGNEFVPVVSLIVTGALAVIAFAAVILFIHHIARQIQADVIIYRTSQKLLAAAEDELGDEADSGAESIEADEFAKLRESFMEDACEISVKARSGYVQFIDYKAAVKCASDCDVRLTVVCGPGEFIIRGRPVMMAAPAGNVDDELIKNLQSAVALSGLRTREQHIEFEMLALVEISLRALSKGINDPLTAISCIDWLSAGLAKLMSRFPEFLIHRDENETVRILEYPRTFEHYLTKTFNPIRHAATEVPIVLERLEHSLIELKQIAKRKAQIDAIDEQLRSHSHANA